MPRCVVVDDDAEIRSSLQDYLRRYGHEVSAAADGAALRRLMSGGAHDVVVLDLMLPGEDGLALCRWLADAHPDVSVLMLTAHGDPISRVLGLEMGADDYLAKPFEPRELLARINAVLRRAKKGARTAALGRHVTFAGWRYDRVLHELTSPDNVVVALSNAEHRLLAAFVDKPRRVLTREQLIELTRAPGVDVNDRSVDLAVSRLRAKLGDVQPALVRTVRGEGYLFDAHVVPA